jgi:hypothetical protein
MRGLRNQTIHTRDATARSLNRIQAELRHHFKEAPTREEIWKSFRNKDLSDKQEYFLWMATHDAYQTGLKWQHYSDPELKSRTTCAHCQGEIEDLDHILTKCETPGQNEIWDLAEDLWRSKQLEWSKPGLGTILGSQCITVRSQDEKRLGGESRLRRLLTIESAHLIWKLRCERIMSNKNREFSQEEIRNRWLFAMNERLNQDKDLTDPRWGKKAIPKRKVLDTWKGSILDEDKHPKDWTKCRGVLVGSRLQVAPGR